MSDASDIALQILQTVRLSDAEEETRWRSEVVDRCHVWGDFYGPATSPHLARAIAHRYLDRQGGDHQHLANALVTYGGLPYHLGLRIKPKE